MWQEEHILYLYVERKPVFLEGEEVKYQLLPAFGKRGKIAITIHVDWLALKNLQKSIIQKYRITAHCFILSVSAVFIRLSYCRIFVCMPIPPQYLCCGPPPQSSPAARGSCPLCRPSCRSSAAEPQQHHSSWRTPQIWPGTARRSAPGITETLDSPSQESGDSLRAKTWGGKIRGNTKSK